MEQINQINPGFTPESLGSEEHQQAMIKLVDEANATPVDPKAAELTTPDVPEKFLKDGQVDVAALAKSYKELEAQFSSKTKEGEQKPAEATPDAKPEGEQEPADAPASDGLTYDALAEEFASAGSLSEATYEKLGKAGLSKELVDDFITTKVASIQAEAFSLVGGQEQYQAMLEWASKSLSQEEIKAFDSAVSGSNKAVRDMAIKGLHSQFSAGATQEPDLVSGSGSVVVGDVYLSEDEMVLDMAKPEYKQSAGFRAKVEAKARRSFR